MPTDKKPAGHANDIAKRIFDLTLGTLLFFVCAPVMVLLCGLIRFLLGPGVFFRQTRPGLDGRPFRILKFRSMTDARSPDGHLLPDGRRLSTFGHLLRSTSLDELPEIVNVLRGEMSLVGPRPLLMQYLPHYSAEQRRRHDVLPGITGWAQINGRNAIAWADKFRLDVWYVDHRSLSLDVHIALHTVKKLLLREGVSQTGHATAEEFCPQPATNEPSIGVPHRGHQR